jgi:hypothetical protein
MRELRKFSPSPGQQFNAEHSKFFVVVKEIDVNNVTRRVKTGVFLKFTDPSLKPVCIGTAFYDMYGACISFHKIDSVVSLLDGHETRTLCKWLHMKLQYLKLADFNAATKVTFEEAMSIIENL